MDREKLIEALDKCYGQPETCGVSSCPYWGLKHPYCECEDRMRKDAIALLKEQAHKFFVDEFGKITPLPVVVRCKDCKWNNGYTGCDKYLLPHGGDWFCADGERKD